MLERRMAQGIENQAEIVEESIQHAREAIALDVKDGNSWYNLGNACLTSFFVTGACEYNKLLQSLKAYQNAKKDERMKSNPDLYFNCATSPCVLTLLDNLEGPVVSQYCALRLLQATLDESLYELAGELVRFLLRFGREFEQASTDSDKLSPRFILSCGYQWLGCDNFGHECNLAFGSQKLLKSLLRRWPWW